MRLHLATLFVIASSQLNGCKTTSTSEPMSGPVELQEKYTKLEETFLGIWKEQDHKAVSLEIHSQYPSLAKDNVKRYGRRTIEFETCVSRDHKGQLESQILKAELDSGNFERRFNDKPEVHTIKALKITLKDLDNEKVAEAVSDRLPPEGIFTFATLQGYQMQWAKVSDKNFILRYTEIVDHVVKQRLYCIVEDPSGAVP